MKQLLFGLHLPVMAFNSDSNTSTSGACNNTNKKNGGKEKQQQSLQENKYLQ
jgi:hypothetical protein